PLIQSSPLFPYTTLFRSQTKRKAASFFALFFYVHFNTSRYFSDFMKKKRNLFCNKNHSYKFIIHFPQNMNFSSLHNFIFLSLTIDPKSKRLNSSHVSISY